MASSGDMQRSSTKAPAIIDRLAHALSSSVTLAQATDARDRICTLHFVSLSFLALALSLSILSLLSLSFSCAPFFATTLLSLYSWLPALSLSVLLLLIIIGSCPRLQQQAKVIIVSSYLISCLSQPACASLQP